MRRRYPSDLSELQWERVAPRLIDASERRKRVRDIADAICYRWRTGCSWRMLPHDFPPWETVYRYFRRWERDGALTGIRNLVVQSQGRRRPQRDSR